MSAFNRRAAIKGALAAAVIPAAISSCAISPAAAAIVKAAPYIPAADGASPDARLLDLAAKFHRVHEAQQKIWDRYCSLPAGCAEHRVGSAEHKQFDLTMDEYYTAWAAASDSCYSIAPQTPAGAAAMLDVIMIRDGDNIDDAVLKPLLLLRDSLCAMVQA